MPHCTDEPAVVYSLFPTPWSLSLRGSYQLMTYPSLRSNGPNSKTGKPLKTNHQVKRLTPTPRGWPTGKALQGEYFDNHSVSSA